jgi:hypothetical protein
MVAKKKRLVAVLVLVSAAGVLMVESGLACASLFGEQALAATDFCFIFDCQNGALGGTIRFCSNSPNESPTFNDCPPEAFEGGGGGGGGL